MDLTKPNNLIVLDKSEIRQYWHLIRPGLEYMVAEKRNPDGWMPEEVFSLLCSGNATLAFTSIMRDSNKGMQYGSRDAAIEDSSGFVVLQKTNNFNESALHIWVAVSNDTTKKDGAGSIMQTFNTELSELAKVAGCAAITFASNQDWWDKIAPRFDFEKQETKWRKEVK